MQTLVKFRDFCFSLTFKLREFANFKALFPAMSMDIILSLLFIEPYTITLFSYLALDKNFFAYHFERP